MKNGPPSKQVKSMLRDQKQAFINQCQKLAKASTKKYEALTAFLREANLAKVIDGAASNTMSNRDTLFVETDDSPVRQKLGQGSPTGTPNSAKKPGTVRLDQYHYPNATNLSTNF